MKGWRIALVVLVVLAAGAAVAWRFLGPVTVEVVEPRRGPAVRAVYGTGTVEPEVMFPIAPKVPGRLERLLVDERSQVRAGQVLAELDSRELAATLNEWQARVRYGEAQFKRADELYRNRTGSEAARDQAKSELDVARASLERVRKQIAELTLTAPADGVIIRRDGEEGELIQPGQTVFWMSCCDNLRITAEIDEEDIPLVRAGQRVMIRADAYPDQVLSGTVTEITPKGDPVARSFRVRIGLPKETPLMIGMTADCNIVVEEHDDALLVPATAVAEGTVWVVADGELHRRAVKLGVVGERLVEVTEGLSERDRVVVKPTESLREGRSAVARPAAGG